ncbi:transcriptional regulator [Tetragenococcus halophilus subsp. flandriensis]|uniref:GntR family transcriptional regulator n=1 Tax=Tetragenococcus halophilus TaxID=51669 RepID=UPI0023E9D4D6|nr:GntR family transcriptional regulator [Tetragenococcus halophilus]GMA08810.1 transcriptional regulator [Tetragenococcus halophilus subsp. flandriensis]
MNPIDKDSPMPLYFQVKEDIIKGIKDNLYTEGNPLPSEFALIKLYDVSRTTIRQAIDQLVKEGYLERRRGKGTYVKKAENFYWELEELTSFNEVAEKKNLTSSTELLSIKNIENNDVTKYVFKNNYEQFFQLERLRFIEKQPSEVVTTYVPVTIATNLDKFDFSKIALFDILKDTYNINISYAEKKFTAINCSSEDAKMLKIKENKAVQLVETVTYNNVDKPVEYSIARDNGLISTFKIVLNKK